MSTAIRTKIENQSRGGLWPRVAIQQASPIIPMRLITQIIIVSVLAGAVAGSWWLSARDGDASSNAKSRKGPVATLVLVEQVKFVVEEATVRAVGTGEAVRSAKIHPSVSGEVVEITFTAGQRVSKGAPLVRLDSEHQRLAVNLAEVALKEATRQMKRLERLAPSGAASVARLQTAQTEQESASLRLAQARAALRDRTVYAPFDGVIGLTDIELGDRVSEQTTIATLDDRSSILVDFRLPEEYASRIALGDKITMRPWTGRDTDLSGNVAMLGSRINAVNRTLRVKAAIPNTDDAIRPGTSFKVTLKFTGRSYASIAEVAVLWSRDGAYIWRATDGEAEKVFVKIVRRDKGRILVDGPLAVDDSIVIEGVQGLRPGQAIRTQPFAAAEHGPKGG